MSSARAPLRSSGRCGGDLRPLEGGEVAERMVGRGLVAVGQVEVVKPRGRARRSLARRRRRRRAAATAGSCRRPSRRPRAARARAARPAGRRCARQHPLRALARRSPAALARRPRAAAASTSVARRRATRISSPGTKSSSRPAQRSVITGTPQAAASNSRTLGDQPASRIVGPGDVEREALRAVEAGVLGRRPGARCARRWPARRSPRVLRPGHDEAPARAARRAGSSSSAST